jgi:hypothetical protein
VEGGDVSSTLEEAIEACLSAFARNEEEKLRLGEGKRDRKEGNLGFEAWTLPSIEGLVGFGCEWICRVSFLCWFCWIFCIEVCCFSIVASASSNSFSNSTNPLEKLVDSATYSINISRTLIGFL